MKRSAFDEWYQRSKEPKDPDGRKTRGWNYYDFLEHRRLQLLKNAFKAGARSWSHSKKPKRP